MSSSHHGALARAAAAAGVTISRSHESCLAVSEHVRASREAIDRSLKLLRAIRSLGHNGSPTDMGQRAPELPALPGSWMTDAVKAISQEERGNAP